MSLTVESRVVLTCELDAAAQREEAARLAAAAVEPPVPTPIYRHRPGGFVRASDAAREVFDPRMAAANDTE